MATTGTTGGDVILSGVRVKVSVPGGGAFSLSQPSPTLSMLVSNPSGQGSTPVTVSLALPPGATFVTTVDKHGAPELLATGWTCDVSADRTEASCTSPSMKGSAEKALELPVDISTTLPGGATTDVTVTTSLEDLGQAHVPTSGAASDPEPADVTLSTSAGALNYIELAADSPAIPLRVHNAGTDDSTKVTVVVTPPAGVTFAGPGTAGSGYARTGEGRLGDWLAFAAGATTIGEWTCDISDSVATCTIPSIAAGSVQWLSLDVTVAGSLASDAVTTIATSDEAGYSNTKSIPTGVAPTARDGSLLFAAEGNLGTTIAGGMIMSCDQSSDSCQSALDYSGNAVRNSDNNNAWAMEEVNSEGGTRNSATTTMAVPLDATVLVAYLVWSANHGPSDAFTGPTNTASIRPPGQTNFMTVTADTVDTWTDPGGRTYYQARADVTDLVQQYGGGSWALADIAVTASLTDSDPSYFGGFALTAVYEQATLPDSSVAIYGGVDPVTKDDDADYTFSTEEQSTVDVSVVAWEGDRGIAGDTLTLDGDKMTSEHTESDGTITTGDPNNAFDSTAIGSGVANALGTDAKAFESETVDAGEHTLTATTDGDNYAVGMVVVQTTPTTDSGAAG